MRDRYGEVTMGLVDENQPTSAQAPPPATFVRYAVEIDGLSDFAGFIDREVDQNIDPAVKNIDFDHRDGLHWGVRLGSGLDRRASDVVSAARTSHNQVRYRSTRNMEQYIRAAQVMVETIHQLMDTYRTAEELSTLTPGTVKFMINTVYHELRNAETQR